MFTLGRLLLAFAVAGLGVACFIAAGLPLPWMLGAMLATAIVAIGGAPVCVPTILRPPMTAVVGVILGATLSSGDLAHLAGWLPASAGVVVFVAVAGLCCVLYFRYWVGLDWPTAYFCGMPGGTVDMMVAGEAAGGDARTIALVHACRVVMVVTILPAAIGLLAGDAWQPAVAQPTSLVFQPVDGLALVLLMVMGILAGQFFRLPAPAFFGPLLLSAALHASRLLDLHIPVAFLNVAQLGLGTIVGCRFAGARLGDIGKVMAWSVGSTAMLAVVGVGCAFAIAAVSSQPALPLVLAYAPGGLAEMGLVALVLHLDGAFVSTMHLLRVFLVMLIGPLMFQATSGLRPKP